MQLFAIPRAVGRRSRGLRWSSASVLALAVAAVGVPEVASACAVCGFGREENRAAFLLTTIFLSALPLVAIGGIVGWLWYRARSCAAEPSPAPARVPQVRPAAAPARQEPAYATPSSARS